MRCFPRYLLGNGINFSNDDTKEKLGGTEFDFAVQDVVREAEITGKALRDKGE